MAAGAAGQPLLDITDLNVTFDPHGRGVRAVRGVDFSIGRGEIALYKIGLRYLCRRCHRA